MNKRKPIHVENAGEISGYKLGEMIGKGGFGAVYKALDSYHGNVVAIKKLKVPANMVQSTMVRSPNLCGWYLNNFT